VQGAFVERQSLSRKKSQCFGRIPSITIVSECAPIGARTPHAQLYEVFGRGDVLKQAWHIAQKVRIPPSPA